MKSQDFIILLVEDNTEHAELVQRNLGEHRLVREIHHVSDGQAALEYLFHRDDHAKHPHPRPDIILLDLRLPKVDGLEVLEQIKADKRLCHIPVIILTASNAQEDVVKAYTRYANSYLVKPVDRAIFTQMIQELGSYWLTWNQQPQS